METVFLMGSVTNAMRGKTVLEQHGYRAFLQRNIHTNDQNGCGYRLLVHGDADKAQAVLRRAGIQIRGIKRGDTP